MNAHRIRFIDALRWRKSASPSNELFQLAANPFRPNRLEPRVNKRRPKPHKLMTQPLKKRLER